RLRLRRDRARRTQRSRADDALALEPRAAGLRSRVREPDRRSRRGAYAARRFPRHFRSAFALGCAASRVRDRHGERLAGTAALVYAFRRTLASLRAVRAGATRAIQRNMIG